MSGFAAAPQARRFPGEAGLWVFLLADMAFFAAMFVIVLVVRADHPALFTRSSAQLDTSLGALNTFLLLGGSLAVVLGVGAARRASAAAPRLLGVAIACGVGFIAIKGVEWGQQFADGTSVRTNEFWGLYFMLTGIHLAHVVVGIGVLTAARRALQRPAPNLNFVDGGACYWHFVDLLWLVLFPLLYLLG